MSKKDFLELSEEEQKVLVKETLIRYCSKFYIEEQCKPQPYEGMFKDYKKDSQIISIVMGMFVDGELIFKEKEKKDE